MGRLDQWLPSAAVYGWGMPPPEDRSPVIRARRRPLPLLFIASIAGALLSAVSIWLLAATTDFSSLMRLIGEADGAFLGVALISLAVSMGVRAARWRVLMPRSRGGVKVGVIGTLPIVLVGYAGNAVLPLRLGDAARGILAGRKFRLGVPEALGSVAVERAVDAAALAGVALIASVGAVVPGWMTQTSVFLLVVTAVILVLVRRGRWIGGRQLMETPPGRFLARLAAGVQVKRGALVAALGLSGLAWCLDGLTFWIGAIALGVNIGWEVGVLVAAGAAIGGILPSAPAAIGTFELAGTAVGVALGLDPTTALAVVAIGHAITVVPLIAAGLISAAWLGLDGSTMRTIARVATGDRRTSIATEPGR